MSGTVDYQALFRGAPTAFVVLDPELVIVEANDAYLAATMRARQELVGKPVFAAFPDNPDDPRASGVRMWNASLRRVLHDRVTDVMEIQRYDIPQPGGGFDVRYWAPVNAPVFGPDGTLCWIVHRSEDVTSYVRAREAGTETEQLASELRLRTKQMEAELFARRRLQRRKETLQAVVDSLEAAVVGSDEDGRPVVFNDVARELIGPHIEEMTAAEWGSRLHLHHADGRPIGEDLPLLRALRGERVRDAEVVRRVPGRPQRIYRVNGRPVSGQHGMAAVVAIHDITAHRRAAGFQECELAIARLIADSLPGDEFLGTAGALIGSLIGWEAVEFWRYDDDARMLRRVSRWADPVRDLADPAPAAGLPERACRDRQPVWVPDLRADDACRDGDWGPLHTALAVPVPSGPHVLGVLVCYSETIEMPEDVRNEIVTGIAPQLGEFLVRRRAEALSAELDRAHDQYLALVGHELRTPLTSIQSYTDLLLDEAGLTEDQCHMLAAIQRNAAGLRAVIAKLLDVASMRAGHLDVRRQPMDLVPVVRTAADAARDSDGAHRIDVHAPDSAMIEGDPHRLRQVADELLANALAWAADGSVVDVRLGTDDSDTLLTVSNTGPRIRADERDRLFDLFFRGDDARHRGIPGTGLGLTLARAIVDQHAGTITVDEPGEVTTFTVRVPTERRQRPAQRVS
ncbi:ATP-binding protein [Actinoplanes sp. GCM10030250]|uniref:PAS domain-containing sensor histidine kinase n=1 Tax=Actinoplanes sp. GCM10030250 TaxID=3273376 RepID=UPI00361CB2B9